jgi:putative acetyltransferase
VTGEPVVRPAVAADDVAPVLTDAFADDGEKVARLWSELASSDLLRASLVAVDGDQVVGHVGLSQAWLDARRELVEVWLLSPLAVAPDRQADGLGTALLAAAVESARDGATPLLVLEGDPGYYGRRGFRPGASFGLLPATDRTPAPAFQATCFDAHEEWMTGRIVYPDVWWRHDAAGLRDPLLATLEERLR